MNRVTQMLSQKKPPFGSFYLIKQFAPIRLSGFAQLQLHCCNSITPSIKFCTISPNDIMSCFEAFASWRNDLFLIVP